MPAIDNVLTAATWNFAGKPAPTAVVSHSNRAWLYQPPRKDETVGVGASACGANHGVRKIRAASVLDVVHVGAGLPAIDIALCASTWNIAGKPAPTDMAHA